jgi:hypothetical protein
MQRVVCINKPKTKTTTLPIHTTHTALPHLQVARKKEASRKAKALRESVAAAAADAADLEAQQQHLLRQQATLKDRIRKLESQVCGWMYACVCARVWSL